MKVHELIAELNNVDPDMEVLIWTGDPKTYPPHVYVRPGFHGGWGYTLPDGIFHRDDDKETRPVVFLTNDRTLSRR